MDWARLGIKKKFLEQEQELFGQVRQDSDVNRECVELNQSIR